MVQTELGFYRDGAGNVIGQWVCSIFPLIDDLEISHLFFCSTFYR